MVKEEERKKHNNNGLILNYIKAKGQGEKVVENYCCCSARPNQFKNSI